MKNIKNDESSIRATLLGVILILIAIGFNVSDELIYIIWDFELPKTIKDILTCIFVIYIGTLFILSYYNPKKTFLFRGLMWICVRISHPKSSKMAFFYFTLCLILGLLGIIQSLGIINFGIAISN